MSPRRLWAIMAKELRQLRRDRMTLAMVVGIPVLQLLLFGYAINTNVRNLPVAVADEAGTAASRALVQDMLASGIVAPVETARSAAELERLLREGRISIGIAVPADFERRGLDGREQVQVLVDGSDPVVQSSARELAQVPVPGRARPAPAIAVLPLYNPERRSAVTIVPGLVGVILTLTMVLFTAVAIVRERERGNLELLLTTPVGRLELMLGKVLPYIGIGLIQTTVVLALGAGVFGVPMRGSLAETYVAALLLIVANLGLGLMISTLVRTQFQAMQMAFFAFLPSMLLSGFMFPFEGMPVAAQWLAKALPLTHFLELVRGIVLRGASLSDMPVPVLALLAFTVVVMSVSVLRFSKRLD